MKMHANARLSLKGRELLPARSMHGAGMRALVVILWGLGLRINEALMLAETYLEPLRGSILVRHGKGGKRWEVGMDAPDRPCCTVLRRNGDETDGHRLLLSRPKSTADVLCGRIGERGAVLRIGRENYYGWPGALDTASL